MNNKNRLFEVMSRLDKTFKPTLNERYSSRLPLIPDAVEELSNYPDAVKFTDKQSFDNFDKQQSYFSAGYSHCFYTPEEYYEWQKTHVKNDPDSEKSVILTNTGDLVQVWDEKNQVGYIIPSDKQRDRARTSSMRR